MQIDVERPLTAFQVRVLRVLGELQTATLPALRERIDQPAEAIRLSLWVLSEGGWVRRSYQPDATDQAEAVFALTAAGRQTLQTLSLPRRGLSPLFPFVRLLALLKRWP